MVPPPRVTFVDQYFPHMDYISIFISKLKYVHSYTSIFVKYIVQTKISPIFSNNSTIVVNVLTKS